MIIVLYQFELQVPFIFKSLVDGLTTLPESSIDLMSPATTICHPVFMMAAPVTMVLGYGIARSSALASQELRNAIFAYVAYDAIRTVSRRVFDHLHSLDMQFHLSKNTGIITYYYSF